MNFIRSDEYPRAFEVTGAAWPLICQVTYVGHGNAHSGHAMDSQVFPLILAAPELLAALECLLPYAENEAQALSEVETRDGVSCGSNEAWDAITNARAAITMANSGLPAAT